MTRTVLIGTLVVVVLVAPLAVALFPLLLMVTLLSSAGNPCSTTVGLSAQIGSAYTIPLIGPYAVTSEFGWRTHPITGVYQFHSGIDLSLTGGAGPIVAMQAGTVIGTPTDPSGGNMVIIDHGGGLVSKYLHLASRTVTAGVTVAAGQQVGIEGTTGSSTGLHLHWTIIQNGDLIDPRSWAGTHGLTIDGSTPVMAGPANGNDTSVTSTTSNASADGGLSAVGEMSVAGYAGEQLTNAGLIIKAGQALGLDAWTITVGVMTAMGESDLVNIGYGDAAGPDSRGLFQQRDNGAWGSLSDRMDPTIAATNFFKALIAVPGYHDLAPTIAAHRTQRNQDPNHYAKYWPAAVQVVASLTSDSSLLSTLGGSGSSVACDSIQLAGGLPAAPGVDCPPSGSAAENGLQPVALEGLRCVKQAFPGVVTMYGVGDRSGASDHPAGLAVDFMIDEWDTTAGRTYGWQVATWAKNNAASLHISYIIFDKKIWSADHDAEGWRDYTRYSADAGPTLLHQDHVHVSFLST